MGRERNEDYFSLCRSLGYSSNCNLMLEEYPPEKERHLRVTFLKFRKDLPLLAKGIPYPVFRSRLRARNYLKLGIIDKDTYDHIMNLHNSFQPKR